MKKKIKTKKEKKSIERIEVNGERYIQESFYNVCRWWLEIYPLSIFEKTHPCGQITQIMKKALGELNLLKGGKGDKSIHTTDIELMFRQMSEEEKDYHYFNHPDSNISKLIAEERNYNPSTKEVKE